MQPEPLDHDRIEGIARAAVEDAISFRDAEIRTSRLRALKYLNGEVDIGSERGRSEIVATVVRDVVNAAKPAVLRALLSSGYPCEFAPIVENSAEEARIRTEKTRQSFEESGGFNVVHDAIEDALTQKVGIVKVMRDERETVEIDEFTELSELAAIDIITQPDVEILELDEQPGNVALKVSRTKATGQIRLENIRPEEFFINSEARTLDDATVCGHSTEMPVADVVALGVDWEKAVNLDADTSSEEQHERTDHEEADRDLDPSMRKVQITEAYMRMDIEGTGVPRLYKLLLGGQSYELLTHELADEVPFADFQAKPRAHQFYGDSLADYLFEDQDALTVLRRGLIDGTIAATNPIRVVNPNVVDMESVMNSHHHGAVIQASDINQIRETSFGFGAAQVALPAMQQMATDIAAKTGVGGPGLGLDADALQGQSATSANIAERAATAQMELMARSLAEGGMKRMCKLIDMLVRQHPDENMFVNVDGEIKQIDPTSWSDAPILVRVGLGNNRHDERTAAMMNALQLQMNIYQNLGPGNPLVGLAEVRNGIAELLKLQGVYGAQQFFKPLTPEREQMLLAQQQQAAKAAQDEAASQNPLVEVEKVKAGQRHHLGMAKLSQDGQFKAAELAMKSAQADRDHDLQRDEMAQDRVFDAAEMQAKHGVRVNEQALRSEQAAPRT